MLRWETRPSWAPLDLIQKLASTLVTSKRLRHVTRATRISGEAVYTLRALVAKVYIVSKSRNIFALPTMLVGALVSILRLDNTVQHSESEVRLQTSRGRTHKTSAHVSTVYD